MAVKKINELTNLGTLQIGDVVLGERVSGTTGLLTVPTLGGGAVDSVNGQTGVVVLDADDISDTSTINKFTSAADETRLANTSGTNTGDNAINTLYSGLATSKQDVITGLTADGTELNILDGATVSTIELNYVDGVTSAIQTQLDGKAASLGVDDNYVTDAEKTKLSNLSGTNTGDQTSIVGLTGTKAQFDTAVSDGNIVYTDMLGTNVAAFLATPSSANLVAALTDETGTGSAVFATSPTLVTPILGTPTSGNLQNCTAATTTTKGVASFATADFALTAGAASLRQVHFDVTRPTNQSVNSVTWTKITLDTESVDTDAAFDSAANYRFTVPAGLGGVYAFAFEVLCISLTDAKQLGADLFVNGVQGIIRGLLISVGATTTQYASGSAVIKLAAGDYIELYGWQDSGGALNMRGKLRGVRECS